MNRKQNIVGVLAAAVLLICFSSCELCVTPLFKGLAKDLNFEQTSAEDVASGLDDMTQDEQKVALKALGEKDEEELKALPATAKKDILAAQVNATLDTGSLVKAYKTYSESANNDSNKNNNTSSSSDSADYKSLANEVVASIGDVDTRATAVILDSVVSVNNDGSYSVSSDMDKTTVATAAVAVMAATMTSENNKGLLDVISSDDTSNVTLGGDEAEQEKALNSLSYYMGMSDDKPAELATPEAIAAVVTPNATADEQKSLAASIKALAAVGGYEAAMGAFM